MLLVSTSSHDKSLAVMMYDRDLCIITLNSGAFLGRDTLSSAEARVLNSNNYQVTKATNGQGITFGLIQNTDLGYYTNYIKFHQI